MTQYVFKNSKARKFVKHGIHLTVYDEKFEHANVVRVRVEKGHLQEFYSKRSTFMYAMINGEDTFMLDDKKVVAEAGDLVVIPAKTRIHYFGTADMVLAVIPAFREEDEVHVRFVDESENPYKNKEV